jgi:hypothetical protein
MALYRMLPCLRIGFGLLAVVAIARQLVVQIAAGNKLMSRPSR